MHVNIGMFFQEMLQNDLAYFRASDESWKPDPSKSPIRPFNCIQILLVNTVGNPFIFGSPINCIWELSCIKLSNHHHLRCFFHNHKVTSTQGWADLNHLIYKINHELIDFFNKLDRK